ncbi:ABC transporter ATP-binding protein [Alicyclobacillus sp. ALC3]|uniref:ABC transporter ATP-binding protein n=1 Tax=Alicyclobacillus sp. ALC3 TaxID=2796143 RepID=UPI0023788A6B|nr:ABC transporter ATP-binding protein [Alicyclobacillus sp. ALC3]WDL95806.1 ABC transporter ATP-binding protein [Alicyclobacillus sp. ALC3]
MADHWMFSDAQSLVEVSELHVRRGGQEVVRNVSFSISAGETVGLIGPNGSGKSSTIGGILGLLPVDRGAIRMGNTSFTASEERPVEFKRRIAYIPEQPLYYSDLTLAEHIDWKMRLWQQAGGEEQERRLEQLIDHFQLGPHLNKFAHQCSKGTLQKLMVVSAFLFPFDFLIIDEPFIGLDVVAIRMLKQYIQQARGAGATILLSTHVLDSAEKMCDRFVFLADGEVFAAGTANDLAADHGLAFTNLEDLFVDLLLARSGGVL